MPTISGGGSDPRDPRDQQPKASPRGLPATLRVVVILAVLAVCIVLAVLGQPVVSLAAVLGALAVVLGVTKAR